jgi:hypothetical protein|tara:strand:- start:1572 stop:1976 length:405 start_codon:yes stop_codon:yes gene_type:complete
MSKDKLIVSQVAFKGAIDLAVAGKIGMEHIMPTTKKFADDIWEAYGTTESSSYSSSFSSSSGGSGGGEASDKQINFIKKLVKEVPKSVADPAQAQVDSGLSGIGASALIKSLLAEKEKSEPKAKQPDNDYEAPF